jgi:MFS family permease
LIQRLPSGLGALGYRDYRLIWSGQVVSNVGTSMQQLGLGWLVVQLAERNGTPQLVPVYLGLVGLARGVPVVFAGLAAGIIADRMDRRKLLLIVQLYWAVVSAVLAWLTIADVVTIGWVVALSVLSAIAQAFDGATRQTVLPRLVPRRAMVSAVGLNSMSFNVAQFIGPMIGGFLIGPIGVGGLMLLNALSFVALIYAISVSNPLGGGSAGPRLSPLGSLREGFAFVWNESTVRWAMLLSLFGNLLARPFQLLFPAFVHDVLKGGAGDLSILMTAAGLGALSGAFGTASLGQVKRRGLIFGCSGVALGLLLLVFGLQSLLLTSVVLAYCVAFASQLFITMVSALFHTFTPDALRGRVMGLQTVVVQGGIATGAMVLGILGAAIGIGAAMSVGGGIYALMSGGAMARIEALRASTGPSTTSPVSAAARPVAETPAARSLRIPAADQPR